MPLRAIGRAWLRRAVLPNEDPRSDGVTVVIGHRNRCDWRLLNALRCLREQSHPSVHVLLVDFGSDPAQAYAARDLCRRFGAEFVPVEGAEVWSRSRCLNIGIRRAATKYLMVSDVDMLFSPRFLTEAVAALERSPLSLIGAAMLDLPETSVEVLRRASQTGEDLQLHRWKASSTARFGWRFHPSVLVARTSLLALIRGYDEFYEVWGAEDDDLFRRLTVLGLRPRTLGPEGFYLHQWHAKYEGTSDLQRSERIERNRDHLRRNHSILRNPGAWGVT